MHASWKNHLFLVRGGAAWLLLNVDCTLVFDHEGLIRMTLIPVWIALLAALLQRESFRQDARQRVTCRTVICAAVTVVVGVLLLPR